MDGGLATEMLERKVIMIDPFFLGLLSGAIIIVAIVFAAMASVKFEAKENKAGWIYVGLTITVLMLALVSLVVASYLLWRR